MVGMRTTMAAVVLAATLAGVIVAAPAQARGCGGRAYAPPTGHWGETASGGSSLWGHPGLNETYRWEVEGDVGRAGVAVRGFDPETGDETWTQQLMVSSGELGRATVPWGNNAATPAIRAFAPVGSPGVFVSFTC
jgi:hypothetical protein